MLNAQARAQAAVDAATASNPNMAKLSPADRQTMLSALTAMYGADNAYLTAAVVVSPGTMVAPPGALVSTAGSAVAQTGATTSAVGIQGAGGIS